MYNKTYVFPAFLVYNHDKHQYPLLYIYVIIINYYGLK